MRIFRLRDRHLGFTLIELLIVVAIIGIIVAMLIPNLIDALQKAKQKRTMADIQLTGTAWMSWLTDQFGAAAAGQSGITVSWSDFTAKTYDQLYSDLVPQYLVEIPKYDGWKRSYEFGVAEHLSAPLPMAIRSLGADGAQSGNLYTVGPFVATDYNQDLVWSGGFFIRWPSGLTTQ